MLVVTGRSLSRGGGGVRMRDGGNDRNRHAYGMLMGLWPGYGLFLFGGGMVNKTSPARG